MYLKHKTQLYLLLAIVGLSSSNYAQSIEKSLLKKTPTVVKYAQTISVDDLKDNLSILASDALEGRRTLRKGQKMAAAYIKSHFEGLNLVAPVKNGDNNSYYQNVEFNYYKYGNETYIKTHDKTLINYENFRYLDKGKRYSIDEISIPVVFAGNGNEEYYEKLDVKNKAVLIIVEDIFQKKYEKEAIVFGKNGAKVILYVVNDTLNKKFNKDKKLSSAKLNGGRASFVYKNEGDKIKYLNNQDPYPDKLKFIINTQTAEKILNTSFNKLTKAINDFEAGKKRTFHKIKSQNISYQIKYNTKKIVSENILGYLEGTDLKDEVLVISAHYDHVGKRNGVVYNGADDNGSGTVAIMDIAEAFAKAKAEGHGPRRSILFTAMTGEEMGLLGSLYYVNYPIFPLENTVANLNIDMIGRIDSKHKDNPNYIYVIGADKLSKELHEINAKAASTYSKLDLDYTFNADNDPNRFYYRSDHWNFAKNNIPVIFYFNGTHADYHKSTDTIDKIEFDLLKQRAQLVFYTAWEIANRDNRLKIEEDKKRKVVE